VPLPIPGLTHILGGTEVADGRLQTGVLSGTRPGLVHHGRVGVARSDGIGSAFVSLILIRGMEGVSPDTVMTILDRGTAGDPLNRVLRRHYEVNAEHLVVMA
jgi:hypothetical protein